MFAVFSSRVAFLHIRAQPSGTFRPQVGARNERRLVAVYCAKESGFEVVHGLLNRVMEVLGVPHKGGSVWVKAGTGCGVRASDKLACALRGAEGGRPGELCRAGRLSWCFAHVVKVAAAEGRSDAIVADHPHRPYY